MIDYRLLACLLKREVVNCFSSSLIQSMHCEPGGYLSLVTEIALQIDLVKSLCTTF